jgi:hypothetical protein
MPDLVKQHDVIGGAGIECRERRHQNLIGIRGIYGAIAFLADFHANGCEEFFDLGVARIMMVRPHSRRFDDLGGEVVALADIENL